jgi:hypothetical protein
MLLGVSTQRFEKINPHSLSTFFLLGNTKFHFVWCNDTQVS